MNGTDDEKARARRPAGTLRPVTPMSMLDKGAQ